MDVSVTEAENRLPELIRAVENGEQVVITRDGKPVAQLVPPPAERRQARLGGMKDRIQLLPGWDKSRRRISEKGVADPPMWPVADRWSGNAGHHSSGAGFTM